MTVIKASEQIFQQANTNVNKQVFGSILYNVKAYGAKGDGVTDDTAAINNTITACSNAGGGIVFIPPGTYIKDGGVSIMIPSNVHVVGSGVGSTTIKLKNNASNRIIFQIANFANNVSISDLSIDGNRDNQVANDGYGVFSYKSNDCKIERVNVTKSCFQGIGLSNCYNYKIIECYSSYNYNFGYWIISDVGQVEPYLTGNHVIDNCDSHYNDLDGILIDSHGSTITNGRFTHNGQNVHGGAALGAAGIYSDRQVNGLKLSSNYTAYNTEFGVGVVTGNAIITNNVSEFNNLGGMFFRAGSQNTTISSNSCRNNGNSPTGLSYPKSGISFSTSTGLTLSSNVCYDDRGLSQTQTYGIEAFDNLSDVIVLSGNTLTGNKTANENVSTRTFRKSLVGNDTFLTTSFNPLFIARKSADQAIPAAVLTKVTYTAEDYDNTSNYDNANSKFIVPLTGVYRFTAALAWNGQPAGNRTILDLYVNGVQRTRLSDSVLGGSTAADSLSSGSADLLLNTTDYVEIFSFSTNLCNTLGNPNSRFSGIRLN